VVVPFACDGAIRIDLFDSVALRSSKLTKRFQGVMILAVATIGDNHPSPSAHGVLPLRRKAWRIGERGVPIRMNRQPIHIDEVFDDPLAVRAMVERHGPYRATASYFGVAAGTEALPWFRGNWAANGQPLVDGAQAILENPRFREAAARYFDVDDVTPNTVVVNVNAPMPAGVIHTDVPSFRGADRDRYSVKLLQAMGSSGLFESWRNIEVGAVVWFYEGPGGAYDYWPEGLAGPMRSERPPFTNRALVADNDRMYHRIGWVGDPAPATPKITPGTQIEHVAGTGWVISDGGRAVERYADDKIRISILWKARVTLIGAVMDGARSPLTPGRIVEIFKGDLQSRGILLPAAVSPLSEEAWLDLVHSTYYSPARVPA
jgi:hypothetical protein